MLRVVRLNQAEQQRSGRPDRRLELPPRIARSKKQAAHGRFSLGDGRGAARAAQLSGALSERLGRRLDGAARRPSFTMPTARSCSREILNMPASMARRSPRWRPRRSLPPSRSSSRPSSSPPGRSPCPSRTRSTRPRELSACCSARASLDGRLREPRRAGRSRIWRSARRRRKRSRLPAAGRAARRLTFPAKSIPSWSTASIRSPPSPTPIFLIASAGADGRRLLPGKRLAPDRPGQRRTRLHHSQAPMGFRRALMPTAARPRNTARSTVAARRSRRS